MKKLALSASMLGAIALAACGGDDGGIIVPDGGGNDGGNVGICNPSTQMGCNPGEKCTALFPTTPGQPIVTGCVPDGAGADGDACARPMGDGNGGFTGGVDTGLGNGTLTDDCAAGLFCDNQGGADICTPICGLGVANTCGAAANGTPRSCVGINGIFDDLPMGSEAGFCTPTCSPTVDPTTCPDGAGCCATGEGCYMLGFNGFVCASPAAGSEALNGLDGCQPRNAQGLCFINSAPISSTMFFAQSWTTAAAEGVITPYCVPVETHSTADTPDRDGDGGRIECTIGSINASAFPNALGTNQEDCRFINTIFSNEELAVFPDDAGVCVLNDDARDDEANTGWNADPEGWNLTEAGGYNEDPMNATFCPGCAPRIAVTAFPQAGGGSATLKPGVEKAMLSEPELRRFFQSMGITLEEARAALKEGRQLKPRDFPTMTSESR
jgi:hypothetical protein